MIGTTEVAIVGSEKIRVDIELTLLAERSAQSA